MAVHFLIKPAFKHITSETHCSSLCPTTGMQRDYSRHLQYSTVQNTHPQRKAGAQGLISSAGAQHLKLHSVHSCPKGDKWQVNTANGLSSDWSATHFSFHNNNAGGESFLSGLLVREWLGEEIGPVIILSSTCPSCRVPPSLTHWRYRLLNPDENPA